MSSHDQGLYVGLMSGTSLDGLDAVLVRFNLPASSSGEGGLNQSESITGSKPANALQVEILASAHTPYASDYRNELNSLLCAGDNELVKAAQLASKHSDIAAVTIEKLLEDNCGWRNQIFAIGNHGQTVRHGPDQNPPYSIQITNGALLAELTGMTVISDFRSRDIAAGGQGAPLVPAFHLNLMSQPGVSRAIVNIGGLANVSLLGAGASSKEWIAEPVLGFDTGPGNTLMDLWVQHHNGALYDKNGDWARSGIIDSYLLQQFLDDPYFALDPPKSTGRELFNQKWLEGFSGVSQIAPQDVQATLCALTANSIASAIEVFSADEVGEVYLCGGGAQNGFLVELLSKRMQAKVLTTQSLGVDPQLVEATAFAWLARQTMLGLPGNLPSATGANSAVVLGSIYPGADFSLR